MVELVDTQDLKSCGHCGCAGSSPAPGTQRHKRSKLTSCFFLELPKTSLALRMNCMGSVKGNVATLPFVREQFIEKM